MYIFLPKWYFSHIYICFFHIIIYIYTYVLIIVWYWLYVYVCTHHSLKTKYNTKMFSKAIKIAKVKVNTNLNLNFLHLFQCYHPSKLRMLTNTDCCFSTAVYDKKKQQHKTKEAIEIPTNHSQLRINIVWFRNTSLFAYPIGEELTKY